MKESKPTPILSKVDQKTMLLNAHSLLRRRMRGRPLWSFVRDITGHGSGYSIDICKECGWDPNQSAGKSLPWFE